MIKATNEPQPSKNAGKSKLSEPIFLTLRDRIVYLEYPQGFVLTEKQLCDEFGVSRTPVREALHLLENMKLVKSFPRYGTCVTPVDAKEIKDTYEVKANLEGLAGRTAAERISDAKIAELECITDRFREVSEAGDVNGMFHYDFKFHEAIWEATANEVLCDFLQNIHARCLRFCMASVPKGEWGTNNATELMAIFDAIATHEPDRAARLLRAHNLQFLTTIKENVFQSSER
jgi:DNA-binding GntR family transcriptional regulator